MVTVLSMGWGVQSTTLAVMAALGDIPKPDVVVHVDTLLERIDTYRYIAKWTPWFASYGVDIITVQSPLAYMPKVKSKKSPGEFIPIPAFTQARDGVGQLRRVCSVLFKIRPQRKAVLDWLVSKGMSKRTAVQKLVGFSIDEIQRVQKDVYPLLQKQMTRLDCIRYLSSKGIEVPPKSSCIVCPYTNLLRWHEMREANDGDWEKACAYDDLIRYRRDALGNQVGTFYCHRSLRPLSELPRQYTYIEGSEKNHAN